MKGERLPPNSLLWAVQTWIETMAAFVKTLDTNHLVGIGEEGFYPQGSPGQAADPLGAQTCRPDTPLSSPHSPAPVHMAPP